MAVVVVEIRAKRQKNNLRYTFLYNKIGRIFFDAAYFFFLDLLSILISLCSFFVPISLEDEEILKGVL